MFNQNRRRSFSFWTVKFVRIVMLFLPGLMLSQAGLPAAMTDTEAAALNLPASFLRIVRDRELTDAYQAGHHRVEAGINPVPASNLPTRNRNPRFVRVVESTPEVLVLDYRRSIPSGTVPPRSYRAPILDLARQPMPLSVPASPSAAEQAKAAAHINQRLAHDGLLSTLVDVIQILGPSGFNTNIASALSTLEHSGFPVDLLACFQPGDPATLINRVARDLVAGENVASLKSKLATMPFHWPRRAEAFQVATESGEHELGLIRAQAGGGMTDGGIVPGASLDVISQMANAFPMSDVVVSVPSPFLKPFQQFATYTWRLRRTNHVTILSEPLHVAAWAQDNGKAGTVKTAGAITNQIATLVPRYACIDEGKSVFEPGESFLMDGLRSTGHKVLHSPLLFQGGNLLAVRHPKSGERILFIGEGELYRNIALGLTREQALEGFRVEFGVDKCVSLTAVSYHLDFDVTFRAHDGELLAFVNDTTSAARLITGLGIDALQRHGALKPEDAKAIHSDLALERNAEAIRRLKPVLSGLRDSEGRYPARLSRFFAAGRMDSAAGNLQCFLLALDWIESASLDDAPASARSDRAGHLHALRRLHSASAAQTSALQKAGCRIISIPSMPDLYRGINYLNGIQHHSGYILPSFGGFYSALDAAATNAFRGALGRDFKITTIQSAECQRQYGGVHCMIAAYPRL